MNMPWEEAKGTKRRRRQHTTRVWSHVVPPFPQQRIGDGGNAKARHKTKRVSQVCEDLLEHSSTALSTRE